MLCAAPQNRRQRAVEGRSIITSRVWATRHCACCTAHAKIGLRRAESGRFENERGVSAHGSGDEGRERGLTTVADPDTSASERLPRAGAYWPCYSAERPFAEAANCVVRQLSLAVSFVAFAQPAQPCPRQRCRVARLPIHEMTRQRARKRPTDDSAARCSKGERGPWAELQARGYRFHRKRADHRHERPEDCPEKPFVACAYSRVALFAPIGRIPRAAFMWACHDLCRVVAMFTAGRAAKNERMPFPELHGDFPKQGCWSAFYS
jgi:hypothetical protein